MQRKNKLSIIASTYLTIDTFFDLHIKELSKKFEIIIIITQDFQSQNVLFYHLSSMKSFRHF